MVDTDTLDTIVAAEHADQPTESLALARKRSIEDMKELAIQEGPSKKSCPADGDTPKKAQEEARRIEKEREREVKRLEKEAKEREKEVKRQEKGKREEEKRREKEEREREREVKKAEAEEKRKAREEERRKKEEEKRLKEEEKRKAEAEKKKKEGHQLKIAGFLKKPAGDTASPPPKTQKTLTISSTEAIPVAESHQATDYEKAFFPFFLKPNVQLAPTPFARDEACRATVSSAIDEALAAQAKEDSMDVDGEAPVRGVTREEVVEMLHIPPSKLGGRRRVFPYTTKDILARINTPDDPELPPLGSPTRKPKGGYTSTFYLELLKTLPTKMLKFAEDVRPPYTGTYSRKPVTSGLRTGRKPFDRALPGVDYDYDSEAEWVADEEGEELLSGDEDEEDRDSVGDEDDLDGFLDDEDDMGLKRGGLNAPVLVPTNSGMCWEVAGKQQRSDLAGMRMEVLMENITAPIDPWSTKYWDPIPKPKFTAMEPPRRPVPSNQQLLVPVQSTSPLPAADPNKKMVSPEDLPAFKAAIDGSDMTKAGLIEVLKKSFPKIPKEAIKNTVNAVAERVGDKKDDKRWVLK